MLVVLACLSAALVISGCAGTGGAKEVPDVEACLKKADFETERAGKDEKEVKDGVSGISGADKDEMTIAIAAIAKSEKDVEKFKKETKSFTEEMTAKDKEKIELESGTDDKYVWVIAGKKDSERYEKARDCVKP